jgi:hypothetical protein
MCYYDNYSPSERKIHEERQCCNETKLTVYIILFALVVGGIPMGLSLIGVI